MAAEYDYTCPNCSRECTVSESFVGQNILCPNCALEFFATPPEVPQKLPFFKSGRRKILGERFRQLTADGELDKQDESELTALASSLRLDERELSKLQKEKFTAEFEPIKRRVESTLLLTDQDLDQIRALEKKYDIHLTMMGNNDIFRSIYLLESKGQLPPPLIPDVMLDADELAYYRIPTVWHQTRVRTRSYSGTSFSVPTGIKGVRLRFGSYTPERSEEVTAISSDTLYVTSERLLFKGDTRSTNVTLKKIVDGQVFSDSVKIEKITGKPDFFSMDAPRARFVLSLIGVLK